jgi:hypothetical protein
VVVPDMGAISSLGSVYQTEQPLPTKHMVPKSGSISERTKRPTNRKSSPLHSPALQMTRQLADRVLRLSRVADALDNLASLFAPHHEACRLQPATSCR